MRWVLINENQQEAISVARPNQPWNEASLRMGSNLIA
jgi:hypothetical protein